MLGGLTNKLSSGKQKESTQASASAGGRAVDPTRPDRYSAGGSNPTRWRSRSLRQISRHSAKGIADEAPGGLMPHFPAHLLMGVAALAATFLVWSIAHNSLVKRKLKLSLFLLIGYVLLHVVFAIRPELGGLAATDAASPIPPVRAARAHCRPSSTCWSSA
jgi:hypothetical protein